MHRQVILIYVRVSLFVSSLLRHRTSPPSHHFLPPTRSNCASVLHGANGLNGSKEKNRIERSSSNGFA